MVSELIFPVFRLREVIRKFFQVVFVEGAVVIDALVHAEVLPILDRLEGMATVRTLEFKGSGNLFAGNKGVPAYFAKKLPMTAIIVINVLMRSTAKGADSIFRDIMFFAIVRFDRLEGVAIP